MKKFSSPVTSSSNYRSLSLPKGCFAMARSIQNCHPEWYTEPAEVQAKRVEGSLAAFLIAVLLTACGENTTTEKIVEVATGGTEIVSSVKDLPKCTKNNQGEFAYVKGEPSARICVDGKWFATVAKDTSADFSCTTKELKDKSGLKIICNGDSIGVVLNGANGKDGADGKQGLQGEPGVAGKDGADGEQGIQGEKGDTGEKGDPGAAGKDGKNGTNGTNGTNGKDGTGCTLAQKGTKVTITCGEKSTTIDIGSGSGSVVDTVELDSEKVSVSLDSVSGVSQKGPFLSGSKVQVKELESGRTLAQTGNNFDGKILNDKGEFRIPSRMMVSQYMMLEASGYYRNEVTGEESKSPLTLFGVTNVLLGNVVNINLLTHLEYERVIYLVVHEKMTVRQAKEQAQKEIFGLLDIDATGFSNSERLSIAGSSDEDGALLAFSIMFQGDRSVAQLTELLTKISTDMEKDGTWDDAKTRMDIADWSADTDSSGRLATIRGNVAAWGLSAMVPNFEQYIRHFWTTEYGLDSCNAKMAGTVKAATAGKRKGSKTRFICKDIDGLGDMRWAIASDFEKDTYQWKAGKDGALKNGDVTDAKYVYDKTGSYNGTVGWRMAVAVENVYGGCVEALYDSIRSYRGANEAGYYQCQKATHTWVLTNNYLMIDTQGWENGTDGLAKRGDSTGFCYVYDTSAVYRGWRTGNDDDCSLGLQGCTKGYVGIMKLGLVEDIYFVCDADEWRPATPQEEIACRNKGVCRLCTESMQGFTEKRDGVFYVCDKQDWREFNCAEKKMGLCMANDSSLVEACETVGSFKIDYVCSEDHWHAVTSPFEYTLDAWNAKRDAYNAAMVKAGVNSDSIITDPRDNNTYRTVVINGKRVFAENLRYADSATTVNLKGQTWCYNNEMKNCKIGGRYYTWTAAVNLNKQWLRTSASALIKNPHQGICPEGWHLPNDIEWKTLFNTDWYTGVSDYAVQQMRGFYGWTEATDSSGFSAFPAGLYYEGSFYDIGLNVHFWSATEDGSLSAYFWSLDANTATLDYYSRGNYNRYKHHGFFVRCFQDDPAAP
ncbi:FISUMP domain-containing protein [uncultured Fibrobacter sp.]|uniref:FISUMP domain-containing protein n=1 Tax=uncultured Fibrobacter sp. TaxID=261512 RepID=UPI00260F5EFB|nr:FISUMP domain-containing protein [uncultured Fibrobacter sp.]